MDETLSHGKYFLGDPCTVLPNKIYHGIWGQQYGHQNGKYTIYDKDFVVHNTYSGDGTFFDTKNRNYVIESGMVGLVAYDLIEDKTLIKNAGHVFDFSEEIQFTYNAGIFCMRCNKKVIMINTKIEGDFNSDEEEIESEHSKEEHEENNEQNNHLNGVFRKLPQPSVSPAAPHPGYSISEDRRDGDIQALLGAAESIKDDMNDSNSEDNDSIIEEDLENEDDTDEINDSIILEKKRLFFKKR